ncbi:pyridoxamine 5'-phosphate oxidase family protein [Aquiflexum sp.]|uniref:pyridoxamine 5'-phosphate oxidase family protein n=1 Tax=Aquiflexum sp. TaxID=1872584 RepID=UPI003593C775
MLFSCEDSLDDIFHAIRHELNRGALDSKHPFRFVSFATQGKEGPDVRYVVLRKIDKDFNFYFFTDARSTKVSQLMDDGNVVLLFYHPGKRTQIKVTGKAEIHIKNELSESFWSSVQGESKKTYNSVLAPGTIIPEPEKAYLWSAEMNDSHFCLIKFSPSQVEGLQLNGLTHIRVQFKKAEIDDGNSEWSSVWLVP